MVQQSAGQMYQIFSPMLMQVHYLLNDDGLAKPVVHRSNCLVLLNIRQFKQNKIKVNQA